MLVYTLAGERAHGEANRKYALADVCRLRALLGGQSVVDSRNIVVPDRRAVDEHLRLCTYDTDSPIDNEHLRGLLMDALSYLREQHGFEFPVEIDNPAEIHDIFLFAASDEPHAHLAQIALKVMHILNHVKGREPIQKGAITESELTSRLNNKVLTVIDELRGHDGVALVEWAAGKKTQSSLVTKLLAKPETHASRVFDRLRYRIVTRDRRELVRALIGLTHRLVPFNYVVPGQSQNGIIQLSDIASVLPIQLADIERLWGDAIKCDQPTPQNEFSGSTYRCVNFVADIPLRVDDAIPEQSPAIAFVQAELQLVDEETNSRNNEGDNAHDAYKERQRIVVRRRLLGHR